MYVIGVTGGIASGKSTLCSMLSEIIKSIGHYHLAVIDADKLGHLAYAVGGPCYTTIVEHFGAQIVAENGEINRRVLGGIVFSDPQKLRELEAIVWPAIRGFIQKDLSVLSQKENDNPCVPVIVIIEAAVLLEAGWSSLCDSMWVVYVDPLLARERLMVRNSLSEQEADKRIKVQMTNSERLANLRECDFSINNSGSSASFKIAVNEVFHKFMSKINPFFNFISPLISQSRAENADSSIPLQPL
jgi:dephospho-CoA kinase